MLQVGGKGRPGLAGHPTRQTTRGVLLLQQRTLGSIQIARQQFASGEAFLQSPMRVATTHTGCFSVRCTKSQGATREPHRTPPPNMGQITGDELV